MQIINHTNHVIHLHARLNDGSIRKLPILPGANNSDKETVAALKKHRGNHPFLKDDITFHTGSNDLKEHKQAGAKLADEKPPVDVKTAPRANPAGVGRPPADTSGKTEDDGGKGKAAGGQTEK